MNSTILLIQLLNGVQYGVLLFLIAAGLTLVFGVMGFINLAHGVQYMIGAYLTFMYYSWTNHFLAALALGLVTALILGLALEELIFRRLYTRDHLDQVLATFGIILFVNELVKVIWGPGTLTLPTPELLSGSIQLTENLLYPVYRLSLIAIGLFVALLLYVVVTKTRVGMLIRAGASDSETVNALGINISRLFMIVFGFGAMLAGLARGVGGADFHH